MIRNRSPIYGKLGSGSGIVPVFEYHRWYMYTDERWVTNANDVYGQNVENANKTGGIGTTPTAEYDLIGNFLKTGDVVKTLTFAGRATNLDVSNIELYAAFRYPDSPSHSWETGIEDDTDLINVVVYNDEFNAPVGYTAFTGTIVSTHVRTVILDYTVPADGYLILYVRPLPDTTIAATRYFYATSILEIEK